MAKFVMMVESAPLDVMEICQDISRMTGGEIVVELKITATISTDNPQARYELGKALEPEPISIEEAAERG